jgi:hypothetical protein
MGVGVGEGGCKTDSKDCFRSQKTNLNKPNLNEPMLNNPKLNKLT